MTVKIRNAEDGDLASWLALWKGYLAFYESELDDEVTLHTWKRALLPDSGVLCRLAEIEGEVVGFTFCVIHPGTWSRQPLCYLEDLFVAGEKRGRGAGRSLIDAVCEEARVRNWSKVYWVTKTDNPARALYDKVAVLDDFVRYSVRV